MESSDDGGHMTKSIAANLMDILQSLSDMLGDCSSTEDAINAAIGVHAMCGDMIADLEKMQKDAKGMIAEVIEETGITDWSTDAGTIKVTAPSRRVTYDSKALDVLMQADADLASRLYPFRKETEVAGSVRITAKR